MGGGCVTHRLRYPRAVDERLELDWSLKNKNQTRTSFICARSSFLSISHAPLCTRAHIRLPPAHPSRA